MVNRLPPEQRRAIVRIRTAHEGQTDWGTGFVVAPGLVLTAYHVVGDRQAPEPLLWAGPNHVELHGDPPLALPYEVVPDGWDREADWALLRFEPPGEIEPFSLSTVGPDDQEWYAFGFAKDQSRDGLLFGGSIRNAGAELYGFPAIHLFSADMAAGAGGRPGGASGSPVIVDGRVVGLLRFALSDEAGRTRAGALYACAASALSDRPEVTVREASGGVLAGMTQAELDRAAAACGLVRLPGGSSTGYLVAPVWLVTWAPSFPGIAPGTRLEVALAGAERTATVARVEEAAGCALLRLDDPPGDVEPLELARCDRTGVLWVAHGFPASTGGVPVRPQGLVSALDLKPVGGGSGVLELRSAEFASDGNAAGLGGLEGAPFFVGGRVVGHLLRRAPLQRAHAVPAERVQALLEEVTGSVAAGSLAAADGDEPASTTLTLPEIGEDEHHVAICYRSEERSWAEALARRLEGVGFRVLFDGYEVGDGPEQVASGLERLARARSAVVVLSRAWADFPMGRAVDARLLELQAQDEGFRVVPAIVEEVPGPSLWKDREGIHFPGEPTGPKLDRLEHALLGQAPPRPGTPAAVALETRARPADDLIDAVRSAEARAPAGADGGADDPDADVQAAEAGGVLRVLELWEQWLESGLDDTAAPLAVAESLVRLSHPGRALEVLDHAGDGTRSRQLRALALSGIGEKLDDAIEILQQLRAEGQTDVETTGLLAGRLKQRWRITGNRNDLQASHTLYLEAFQRTRDHYPGINAAATALGLGNREDGIRIAGEVRDLLAGPPLSELDDWAVASLGEAQLVLGDLEDARTTYAAAIARRPNALRELVTMRRQIRENLARLDQSTDALDDLFFIPRVAAFTGHMTDTPDRPTPRFPEERVPRVREGIREAIRRLRVGIGYCSAARGSDLLFVEEMVDRNGEVNVILPFPVEAFLDTSVGPDWTGDFRELLEREGVELTVLLDEDPGDEEGRARAYAECNREIVRRARARGEQLDEDPVLVHVWDGRPGDGRGGTADLIRTWRKRGLPEAAVGVGTEEAGAGEGAT